MEVELYETIKHQVELLPRITIIYTDDVSVEKGFAIEWLWFGIFFNFKM